MTNFSYSDELFCLILRYNTTNTVSLQDIGELSDTTTVTITVEDYDNLNPYFDHSLYEASIEENQVNDV